MADTLVPERTSASGSKWRSWLGYGLITFSVWLSWEIIKVPLVERAPPLLALRLAPTSPEALRRASEAALLEGDGAKAGALAGESLARAPFNARALRVAGLAEAEPRDGDVDLADQLLTLAGNWSLRDDPAHAWLMERRLSRGDYASSFAHADTLVRRRGDLHPQLFNLFTTAALSDPRALEALIGILSTDSPWRLPYLDYLITRPDTDALLLTLGLGLNRTTRPLNNYESGQIYRSWVAENRFSAVRALAESRPGAEVSEVVNGDFSAPLLPDVLPLGWDVGTGPGFTLQIVPGESPDRQALNVNYAGYTDAKLLEQLILLRPGRYDFVADHLLEGAVENTQLSWTVRCAGSETILIDQPLPGGALGDHARIASNIVVPADKCDAQWLRIETRPDERRAATSLTITRVDIRTGQ